MATTEIAAPAYSRPWHAMPDMAAALGAAYVRLADIQHWIPEDELLMQEREEVRRCLGSAEGDLYRAPDFFSHEEGDDEEFCRAEIEARLREAHDYMNRAVEVFRNSRFYRENRGIGWEAFVDRASTIPAH